jgi:MoaA/NifB/PqqE/SkfB family radical SAM enzyme
MVALTLLRQGNPLAEPAHQLEVLASTNGHKPFERALHESGISSLQACGIDVLQVNVGKLCNQTCRHCHVDAGPDRREIMSREIMQACLDVLDRTPIPVVDVTGGAPEMNPHFRWFVAEARRRGRHVIDRCNLTILLAPGYQDLPAFLAEQRVEVVASLPCYLPANTDAQRGEGVFEKSIRALQQLNALGYGQQNPQSANHNPQSAMAQIADCGLRIADLVLTLVYNPIGPALPPPQASLEAAYRKELRTKYGVEFTRLYTITNMPISRFLDDLLQTGRYEAYMQRLIEAYNPAAVAGLMCRNTLSVGWDGRLYDCDFNQMLDLDLGPGLPRTIHEFDAAALQWRPIVTGQHCYGCTAGTGSGCQGAIVAPS